MLVNLFKPFLKKVASRLPLQVVLTVPFMVQVVTATSLVGYLSYRNGQQAVNTLADQLMSQVSDRVDQQLDNYLALPHQINQLNLDAIQRGLLDPKDLDAAGRYFFKQSQVFKNFSYVGYALPDQTAVGAGRWLQGQDIVLTYHPGGSMKDYTHLPDQQGKRTKLIYEADYSPVSQEWYQDTVKAKKPIWSRIYLAEGFEGYLSSTAGAPIYDAKGQLRGVLGVDLLLRDISTFLAQIKVSPAGQVFIVERDGMLVANSDGSPIYRNLSKDKSERIKAYDSRSPVVKAVSQQLQAKFGTLHKIRTPQKFDFQFQDSTFGNLNQRQFTTVIPWQDQYGLDWLIVVTVPESDFMGQINANTRTTILLCLCALGIATLFGMFTARWISRPIRQLSEASAAIAAGNLDQIVNVEQVQELQTLARSFNAMAEQLKGSFSALEKNNEILEQRVEERTAELQEAKDSADAASHAKSEFLANMSHELRTPLNGILGYAQILQRDPQVMTEQKVGLNVIYQCGTHLLTLINDILDIAKIEARKLELSANDFHLGHFLQDVQDICRIRAEQKEIRFTYVTLNQLPFAVNADEKRLRQVLINLLGNAVKFTEKGEVTLKVGTLEDGRIRFQVEDTGIGMPSTHLQKIFLPFEQVGDRNQRAEGTGLGLSITQQILSLMGSQIEVESTQGVGSTFRFDLELPTADYWDETQTVGFHNNIIGYEGPQKTLLVVDDRRENRNILVDLLTPLGFAMIEAENGQDGLEKAQGSIPDLIVTDLIMPEMGGFEMTQRLRQRDEFKTTPIIASSASVFDFNRQQSEAAGCSHFLPKPIQTSELFSLLQQHLNLVWRYGSPEPSIEENSAVEEITIPPAVELQELYRMAKSGYIADLKAEVERLRQLSSDYSAFVNHIAKLADNFETKAIAQFIQTYL
jgi:signal transduction histidine kinase/ActR/RegA family two-component response regulator